MSVEPTQQRSVIFFSYSHLDKQWLREFQQMLAPIVRANLIQTWADTDIQPGGRWEHEIETALRSAKVAVLLVSNNFLASDFINKHELPPLLDAAEKEGLTVLWVFVSACMYKYTPIADFKAAHDIRKPLDMFPPPKRKHVMMEICDEIFAAFRREGKSGDSLFRSASLEQIPEAVKPIKK